MKVLREKWPSIQIAVDSSVSSSVIIMQVELLREGSNHCLALGMYVSSPDGKAKPFQELLANASCEEHWAHRDVQAIALVIKQVVLAKDIEGGRGLIAAVHTVKTGNEQIYQDFRNLEQIGKKMLARASVEVAVLQKKAKRNQNEQLTNALQRKLAGTLFPQLISSEIGIKGVDVGEGGVTTLQGSFKEVAATSSRFLAALADIEVTEPHSPFCKGVAEGILEIHKEFGQKWRLLASTFLNILFTGKSFQAGLQRAMTDRAHHLVEFSSAHRALILQWETVCHPLASLAFRFQATVDTKPPLPNSDLFQYFTKFAVLIHAFEAFFALLAGVGPSTVWPQAVDCPGYKDALVIISETSERGQEARMAFAGVSKATLDSQGFVARMSEQQRDSVGRWCGNMINKFSCAIVAFFEASKEAVDYVIQLFRDDLVRVPFEDMRTDIMSPDMATDDMHGVKSHVRTPRLEREANSIALVVRPGQTLQIKVDAAVSDAKELIAFACLMSVPLTNALHFLPVILRKLGAAYDHIMEAGACDVSIKAPTSPAMLCFKSAYEKVVVEKLLALFSNDVQENLKLVPPTHATVIKNRRVDPVRNVMLKQKTLTAEKELKKLTNAYDDFKTMKLFSCHRSAEFSRLFHQLASLVKEALQFQYAVEACIIICIKVPKTLPNVLKRFYNAFPCTS